jgi:HEPN domain-containing protein
MPPEPDLEYAREWLEMAQGDLEFASHYPAPERHYKRLCFFAQQAAEKAIKAVLVKEGVDFPFVHNVERLLKLVPPQVGVPPGVQEAKILTDYAAIFRYLPHPEPPGEEDWREALRLAGAVVEWAEAALASGQDCGR